MKILFIYKYEYVEPLGIMYLSSLLRTHGHHCYFIDLQFADHPIEEIQRISPDIVAYSITTGKHKFYRAFNQELKKNLTFFSIFGGPHCTFSPQFIYEEGVDAICMGEGEFPFLELANNLEAGRDLTQIKNLWIKLGGEVYKNDLRPLIADLDILPPPDRELVNKYRHYRNMHRRYILTGRGCPYHCTYCFNHSYNKLYANKGNVIRKRSIGNVLQELKFVKDTHRPERFQFVDDTFILDYEWTLEFCEAYRREINIPFIAYVRVNLVKEEIVKALKDAGCITIVYAIESGDERLRNNILKRGISDEQIITASKIFEKYGLSRYVQNMVGLPDETLDMAFRTVALNIECKASYSWVSMFQPYPMTDLWEYSKERGYFKGDVESVEESFYERSVMKLRDIEKMERLRHLFSLCVAFPSLVGLVRILIELPLNRVYQALWNLHRAWCYCFKVKWMDLGEVFIREW